MMDNNNNNHQQQPQQQPQQIAQPQPQPAQQPQVIQQYVVQEKSLKGLGGALIFWMIVFSLYVIGSIALFAAALTGSSAGTGSQVVTLLFTPFTAVSFAAAVVLIALQKKIAVIATFVALGIAAAYSTINSIATFAAGGSEAGENVPMLIAGILISLLVFGLVALYFVVAKRVKQTLVN